MTLVLYQVSYHFFRFSSIQVVWVTGVLSYIKVVRKHGK